MPSDHDQHEQQDEIDETTAYDGFQYEPGTSISSSCDLVNAKSSLDLQGYGEAGRLGPFDPTAAPGQYEYQPNTGMGLQQGSNTHAWGQQHGGIASSSFHQPPLGQQFPPEFGPGSLQYAVPPFSNPYVGGQPHPNVPTLPQVPSQRSGTPGPSRLDQMLPIMPGQLMENSPGGEQCPMCPARFDRPTRLQGHINAHQGIRPHICGGECGDTQW
jgi:hypothetical protein